MNWIGALMLLSALATATDLARGLLAECFPSRPPAMRQWAEETIIIPDGPFRGEPFRCAVQPFSGVFFDAIDSGQWERIAAIGPTQTGKSLICYVIPVCYHLAAIGETVVAGIPTMSMAQDKWLEDFLPVFEASPVLRELLPVRGEGSRGGTVKTRVKLRNGATLRFMSGGGSDKTRAAFTTRVLAVTEVDGLDQSGADSREADKLKQMEGRLRAYLRHGTREYLECTVSYTSGRIWQEYLGGTQSQLVRPCPHCRAWVTLEREHLAGWQGAEDELEARASASWLCPACAALWTEEERYAANLQSRLLHRGQKIDARGRITGDLPRTRTLGFRWTAADNHFATAADVASDEWQGARELDRDNAERKLCQFVHCIPWDPPQVDLPPIDPAAVAQRVDELRKGMLPKDCPAIAVGVDTGKRALHWTAFAARADGRPHVCEYGVQPVECDKLGVAAALKAALDALRAYFSWGPEHRGPDQVWIDSRYHEHSDAVYQWCRAANKHLPAGREVWRPLQGYGEGKDGDGRYHPPKALSREVRFIGDNYHLAIARRAGQIIAHVNGDRWKALVHEGLTLPDDQPQAITLYAAPTPAEHQEFARQIAAERAVPRGPEGYIFQRVVRANHYLDASHYGRAALDYVLTLLARSKEQGQGWWKGKGARGEKAER